MSGSAGGGFSPSAAGRAVARASRKLSRGGTAFTVVRMRPFRKDSSVQGAASQLASHLFQGLNGIPRELSSPTSDVPSRLHLHLLAGPSGRQSAVLLCGRPRGEGAGRLLLLLRGGGGEERAAGRLELGNGLSFLRRKVVCQGGAFAADHSVTSEVREDCNGIAAAETPRRPRGLPRVS